MTAKDSGRARVDALLAGALELPERERREYMRRECGGDADLLAMALGLLDSTEDDDDFLTPGGLYSGALWGSLAAKLEGGALLNGEEVGSYRVVRELGRGGMAVVYLAERADEQFEQQVALKILKRGTDTDEVAARFAQERQILASLGHANIARLLDGGVTAGGRPFFAMEFIDGTPIDTWCDERTLSVDARLRLFCDVGSAIQYAHRNLVVHRDLKPSNIFVTGDGQVKLLDFGIAKLLGPAATLEPLTRTTMRVMTPEYASPEQVRGATITTASDVYQLGLLLYELLCGHRAHGITERTAAEIERVICEQDPRRPSTAVTLSGSTSDVDGDSAVTPATVSRARGTRPERLRRRLAGDLDNIVLKALRKEPESRYPSVTALLEDIERHRSGLPVLARAPTVGYRARKFVKRHTVGVIAASLVILSVLGGLVGTAWQGQVAARERDRARHEAETARRVSEFLIELFRVSDPDEGRGRSVTAFELLEQGASRIEEELQGEPEIQAAMMDVMGRVYLSLGLYEPSAPLLEKALATRQELYGDAHEDVAASLDHMGQLRHAAGGYDDAEDLYRRALEVRRELFGPIDPRVAESLRNLAMVIHLKGEYDAGLSLAEEALAMRRELYGEMHPDVAASLKDLAQFYQQRQAFDRAAPLLEKALEIRRELLGPEHPAIADSLNGLGMVMQNIGQLDRSEQYHREALEMRRRLLGPEHPNTIQSVNNLGSLLYSKTDYEGAEPLFREALRDYRARLGDKHPRVANSMANLAVLLSVKGDLAAAEPLYREAIEIRKKVYGERHRAVGDTTYFLAKLLSDMGRSREAEENFREALGIYDEGTRAARDSMRAALYVDLGELLLRLGRLPEAGGYIDEGLSICSEHYGEDYWRTAAARSAKGAWHLARSEYAEAEAALTRAHGVLKERRDGDARRTLVEKRLAALHEAWDREQAVSSSGF